MLFITIFESFEVNFNIDSLDLLNLSSEQCCESVLESESSWEEQLPLSDLIYV